MKNIVFLIALLLAGVSCKKKGPIEFVMKGKVTDATFNKGLEGAMVTLTEIPIGNGTSKVVGSTVLGADGGYSFTFERDKAEKYHLLIEKTNYFTIEEDIPFGDFSSESETEKNYSTTAKAWAKIRFVNVSPANSTDILKFIRQEGKTGCPECCVVEERSIFGVADTSFICINDGNTNYSYFYSIVNSTAHGSPVIYTTAFDTVEFVQHY